VTVSYLKTFFQDAVNGPSVIVQPVDVPSVDVSLVDMWPADVLSVNVWLVDMWPADMQPVDV
jgi:hypothetical protein